MSQVSSESFVKKAVSIAKASSDQTSDFKLGLNSVLTVKFNGGLPLFWLKHKGREFEPTMSELLEVVEGASL